VNFPFARFGRKKTGASGYLLPFNFQKFKKSTLLLDSISDSIVPWSSRFQDTYNRGAAKYSSNKINA
jgi:hypothetical protein